MRGRARKTTDPLRGKRWAEIKEAIARGEVHLPTSDELMRDMKAFTIFDEHSMISRSIFDRIREYEENRIRECLGRWVSELPPMLMYQRSRFIGLGLDGDLSDYPKVYIKAPDAKYFQ
jgi:hypothetical protein